MQDKIKETITRKWLATIGFSNCDISSNGQSYIRVITEDGTINIITDIDTIECQSLTVTAISSFSWNSMVVAFRNISRILPYITVHEWGWLYGSYHSVLLKTFYDQKNAGIVTVGFDLNKLQEPTFVRFVESCCDMKFSTELLIDSTVNRNITFSVPINNPFLTNAIIRDKECLFQCLRRD